MNVKMNVKTIVSCTALALKACGLFACLALFACASTSTSKQQYYILNSQHSDNQHNDSLSMISGTPHISIRSVNVPEYLNQRGIAQKVAPGKIMVSNSQLWAQPLSSAIPTVLAQSLAVLKNEPIEIHPLPPGIEVDTIIEVTINRFVADTQQLMLQAHYRLIKNKQLRQYQFSTDITLDNTSTEALVIAYDNALAALATDIAKHL